MKAIRRWLRILTRPFPDDAVYVPRLLRCHTPLSVIVFLLLLGVLIFLPRNELFRQDVAVTKGHLDLWHFLFFALACAGFWLLAIGFRLLVRRFGKRQSDRWGFHAIQCIAMSQAAAELPTA